ncbi:peroxide stress protein YaaA [Cellulomonas fimi]|uniref:YaaA family protein n=1 Tax=Cellulomonas sp. RIT-PI-Y TaxID=3035297 RepID=UPI0021DB42B5
MLILLPPSEGKTAPADGPALDLAALSGPGLTAQRRRTLSALVTASRRKDAPALLGVGATLGAEVARNTALRTAPTAQARRVYTGVLYAAAGLDTIDDPAALDQVRTVSGLWGLVSPVDPIPAYRLSMGVDLPGIGPLAPAWRPVLAKELDHRDELIVDCRSAAYLAAWKPVRPDAWVQVRVLRELDGKRSVVSHHAKHTRGVLTRHLLTRPGAAPTDPESLAKAAWELVGTELIDVELSGRTLSLVVG